MSRKFGSLNPTRRIYIWGGLRCFAETINTAVVGLILYVSAYGTNHMTVNATTCVGLKLV
jgi:hypothetical protein